MKRQKYDKKNRIFAIMEYLFVKSISKKLKN